MPAHKLDLVHLAIRSGILGHIQWKESADRLARQNPALPNLNPDVIRALLRQFVIDGNELDVRRRPVRNTFGKTLTIRFGIV